MCNRQRAIPKDEEEEENKPTAPNKPTSPSGKVDWWLGHCGRGPGGGPILGATARVEAQRPHLAGGCHLCGEEASGGACRRTRRH
jgi:hypothetical protein